MKRIIIFFFALSCVLVANAEYNKYIVTIETPLLRDYQQDCGSYCMLQVGDIVEGESTNDGVSICAISFRERSNWGYINPDCVRLTTQSEIDSIQSKKTIAVIICMLKWFSPLFILIMYFFIAHLVRENYKKNHCGRTRKEFKRDVEECINKKKKKKV